MALSNSSSGNNYLVDEHITNPVLQLARETEAKRQRWLAGELQENLTNQNLMSLLGEPILQLLPSDCNPDDSCTHNSIRAAIRICRNEAVTAPSFVEAIRYLVWQPPATYIETTFSGLLPSSASLFIDEALTSKADVMRYFIDQLGQIDDKKWSVDTIQTTLDNTARRVTYREADGPPVTAGYKFLRWALLGLNNGPQISHLMGYLGRTETLRRLKLADTVASSLADSPPDD